MNNQNLSEIKAKTMELLQTNDEEDVSYITQELIEQDAQTDFESDGHENAEKINVNIIEGHNVRYAYYQNRYGYAMNRGSSYTGAGCGNNLVTWVPFEGWQAKSIGRCSGNDHLVRFTRI